MRAILFIITLFILAFPVIAQAEEEIPPGCPAH